MSVNIDTAVLQAAIKDDADAKHEKQVDFSLSVIDTNINKYPGNLKFKSPLHRYPHLLIVKSFYQIQDTYF